MPKIDKIEVNKPPYRVPLMTEVAVIPWNGLTVASTFSGCGGSCTGYRMAGFRVGWASEFVPAAQDSYKANMALGSILDPRDIRLVQPEEILKALKIKKGQLDLFDGSPPCFAVGTPVTTLRGVVPIETVVVGDMVLTHRCRWRRVVRTISRKSPTIIIDGRIECVPEHKFYAMLLLRRYDTTAKNVKDMPVGDPIWLEASRIEGNRCATPVSVEQFEYLPAAPDGFAYSEDFWYMVGRWVGDGWLRLNIGDAVQTIADRPVQNTAPVPCPVCGKPSEPNRRIAGAYTNYCSRGHAAKHKRSRRRQPRSEVIICTETSDAADLKTKMELLGTQVGISVERTVTKLRISRKSLAEWLLTWFGRGAGNKTLPGWCLSMRESWRRSLFVGYDAADGDGKRATTISRCLAVAVAMLANGLGKTVGVSKPYQNKKAIVLGRVVNVKPQWQVSYNEDDGKFTEVSGGLRWKKVRRATKPGAAETVVYDIEVEEDHSFVADTFVVHNCQAFSTAGKRHKGWGQKKKYEGGHEQTNEDLFQEYLRLLRGLLPKTFVAENVSGLVKGVCKGYFLAILKDMKAAGYRVVCRVLDAQWLGVPQQRQRCIFVGVREDLKDTADNLLMPCHPSPLPWRYSVRDAIPWLSGSIDQGPVYDESNRSTGIEIPCPTVKGVGIGAAVKDRITVSGPLVRRCNQTGESLELDNSRRRACNGENVYGCVNPVNPDNPAGTVQTVAHDTPLQTERRKFSIAELQRICAFPDDFILTGSYSQQWERLGNSVPPVMMFWIARTIRDRILLPALGRPLWKGDPPCLLPGY